MTAGLKDISMIFESGSRDEKIRLLESLSVSDDPGTVRKIISRLDDPDIQVRGEAFASLVINENRIDGHLVRGLGSDSRYVRGFSALILANRGDSDAAPDIAGLTGDPSAMVRSCALGALGFLGAAGAGEAIRRCCADSDLEVRKSAVMAAIDTGEALAPEEIATASREMDPELERLIERAGNAGVPAV